MFAGLVEYQSQTYYEAHPMVWYLTPTHEYAIRLFSGYVSDTRSSAWQKTFEEEGAFEAWLEEITGKSCFEPEPIPEELDKVVTLSTCTYDFDTAKFVLHGYIESCRAYE